MVSIDFLRLLMYAQPRLINVLRYDALTISNEVYYQNSLSAANLPFAKACGRILTNYCWTDTHANESKNVATESGFASSDVFFGIDVWAQNNTGLTHPRSTYPRRGGGGTNTGIAVAKLAEQGLSAGIFAPAWSFEHFVGHGKDIERVIWEGQALPSDLDCSCGNTASRHRPIGSSITQDARCFPAGSETFFYTDFARAFTASCEEEKHNVSNTHTLHAQLGSQALFPLPAPPADPLERFRITHKLEDNRGHSRLVIESHNSSASPGWSTKVEDQWLTLYKLDMPVDGSLRLSITYRSLVKATTGAILSLYIQSTCSKQPQLISIPEDKGVCTIETKLDTYSRVGSTSRVEELGFHFGGSVGEGIIPLLELYSILIIPDEHLKVPQKHSIHSIHAKHCGEGENRHTRLCWNYTEAPEARMHGMPYSNITGAFSHFVVNVDGTRVGRAYALEFIVEESLVETVTDQEVAVEIIGVGFDGRNLACKSTTLRIGTEQRNA
jgi:hypothetical protein